MKAKLILENGMEFEGRAFGYTEEAIGEVVFNTSMTGYQEILTDPSYYGQIVTMTYPLVGNYGLNLEDLESDTPKVKGFIVREKCDLPNNWRCEMNLDSYLKLHKVMGLEQIDTRALTKVLRNNGTMKGIITTREISLDDAKALMNNFSNKKAVNNVTTKEKYVVEGKGHHVAIMDFGIKSNIIRNFIKRDCKLTVFPAETSYKEILEVNPDLVFLSNGPGDPEDLTGVIENIKQLVDKKPIAGICLGHQLLCIALGGKTGRLKFGHRGANHPVKDLEENKIFITSQNHGYVVREMPENTEVTHINVNDSTVEGMRNKKHKVFSVQFHPEACPGPQENQYLFDKFLDLI